MHRYLLRIVTILALTFAAIPVSRAYAVNNIAYSGVACRIKRPTGAPPTAFAVSAALHNNGLVYVAVNNGTSTFSEAGGGFFIVAYDPNVPTPDANGFCQPVASYVVQFADTARNLGKGRGKQMPAIVKADADGNVYVGRVSTKGFRLLIIAADAPATAQGALSYDHMYSFSIEGATGSANSGGGLGVNDDYVLASISADMTAPQMNRFTVLSKNTLFALGTISSNQTPTEVANGTEAVKSVTGTWTRIMNSFAENAYSKFTSGNDAVAALPDGRFFVAAAFEISYNGAVGASLAGFVNPVTRAVTNVYTGAPGWTDFCGVGTRPPFTNSDNPPRGILGMCYMPSAYMGLDNNLYVGLRGQNGKEQVMMRYNTNLKRWESPKGEPAIVYKQGRTYFETAYQQVKYGSGIAADGVGQVFIGNIHNDFTATRKFGPVNIAYYNLTDDWKKFSLSLGGNEYGKPHLMITPFTGEPGRLSVFYVRNIWEASDTADAIWATYKGNIFFDEYVETCKVNMVVNGGLTYLNTTNASVALYSSKACASTQYYAEVTNSATPPASVNLANLQDFDQASGVINVTGLTGNAVNYIHVKLYGADDVETTGWMTQDVYADTAATVGATYAITSPYDKPRYTDVSSMNGSSYTDTSYIRSSIGRLTISAVTDPTGLSSYQVNDDPAVNYTDALLGQNSLIMMRESAGSMGASISLKDGAGNVEVRNSYPLTLDAQPPVPGGTESITFAATGSSPFNGEVTLVNGNTTTDNEVVWGLWLASAYCGATNAGCPAADSSSLRWGGVPMTSYKAQWNLLTGNNVPMQTGLYRVYARILDGAGNPTSNVYTTDVSVTLSANTVYAPILFAQR